jgi:diamine N-acetyltransferase
VDDGAEGFWRRCGFADTGRTRHGEPVFVRAL